MSERERDGDRKRERGRTVRGEMEETREITEIQERERDRETESQSGRGRYIYIQVGRVREITFALRPENDYEICERVLKIERMRGSTYY